MPIVRLIEQMVRRNLVMVGVGMPAVGFGDPRPLNGLHPERGPGIPDDCRQLPDGASLGRTTRRADEAIKIARAIPASMVISISGYPRSLQFR
jgi:hypothetical protein